MTESLIVLVPVLDRPANVAPLIESWQASKTPGILRFLVTDLDYTEIAELKRCGADYWETDLVTWPEKINRAYTRVRDTADWILFGADDVTFHEDWFANTAPLRATPEISVIGTNDLGNPRVLAGDHTTHPLVRSTYLGTVDDPEAIVHTGYHHWCVDDEFLWTAKLRGCWVFCPTAVVEHNHPYWGKGEMDETYVKGEANAEADMNLWKERAKLLGLEVRA